MQQVVSSRVRLQIYRLAVDGLGPSSGLCQSQIAGRLEMSRENVRYHINALKREGFILEIPGTKRPQFYRRGPQSNILDKVCVQADVKIDGGTVDVKSESPDLCQNSSTPVKSEVTTARTHINGRVVFEVLKKGDMHGIIIKDGQERRETPLFPKDPYLDNRGVKKWRCQVPFDGFKVSMEYTETSAVSRLTVWPPQIMLVPEQFPDAERIMITRAQQAVNLLAKHGHWQFGLVQFDGNIEFASTDDRLLSQIPEDMKRYGNSPITVDRSEGPREIEATGSNSVQAAKIIFDLPNVVKKLEDGQTSSTSRLYTLEIKADKMLEILEKLSQVLERDAELQAILIEKGILNTAERIAAKRSDDAQGAQASANSAYDGVMYQ